MARTVFRANGTGRDGTPYYFTVPKTGVYLFTLKGAAGGTGSVDRNGTIYSPTPGNGAILKSRMTLTKGEVLLVVVGQRGDSSVVPTTDGCGGGSGGATWIFRKIDAITDETYQTTISGIDGYWECLFCAAGGCGTVDAAYRSSSAKAEDASDTVYSLGTHGEYKAFSTSTANTASSTSQSNVVLSLNQIKTYGFRGAYYVRSNNYGYGGYGCGHTADDDRSAGGGWTLSNTSYRAASWAAFGEATAEVNDTAEGGEAVLLAVDTPEELHPNYLQPFVSVVVESVSIIPNPVFAGAAFSVTATVTEEYVYPTVEALFEFPMDLSAAGLPLSKIVY